MKRILEFEALRGALALWVVIGHVLKNAGYEPNGMGALAIFAQPDLAVDVFIMLSGFVIFQLLEAADEKYWGFIIRRFFRLYPLYFVVLVVSALAAPANKAWISSLPWTSAQLVIDLKIANATIADFWSHLAVHLTMFHGLFPDSVLPFSDFAIVGQAWSISVEWQFYLVAPLILVLLRRSPIILALAVICMYVIYRFDKHSVGFAINQAPFFAIGIISYFVFKHRGHFVITATTVWLGAAISASLVLFFAVRAPSLLIWIAFLSAALLSDRAGTNPISAICRTWALQFLGKISYSIYLCHMLVLLVAATIFLHVEPHPTQIEYLRLILPLTLVLTIIVSSLTFYLVEQPGMRLGKRLADAAVPHAYTNRTPLTVAGSSAGLGTRLSEPPQRSAS